MRQSETGVILLAVAPDTQVHSALTEVPKPMRERIFSFLQAQTKPLPADVVLRQVLGIQAPNAATADRVLDALVRDDPRFMRAHGRWSVAEQSAQRDEWQLTGAAVLFIEEAAGSSGAPLVRGAAVVPETGFLARFGVLAEEPDYLVLPRVQAALENRVLVTWGRRELQLWRRYLSRRSAPAWNGESLQLSSLAKRVLGLKAANVEPLSAALGVPPPDRDDPAAMVRFLSSCLQALLGLAPEEHRYNLHLLQQWIEEGCQKVDFTRFGFGPGFLRELPGSAGIYVMKNRAEEIIYVGKSRNLKRRVMSYFTRGSLRDRKVQRIHEQLHTVDVMPTVNEVEALLLEMSMIRDFRPHINLQEEVHESPRSYGKRWNCALLIPRPLGDRADIYLLRDGAFFAQASARLGRPAARALRARVRAAYFGRKTPKQKQAEPWETEIVARWLGANKARINYIDIDDAGTCDHVLRLLDAYLRDPDRLARKVQYR